MTALDSSAAAIAAALRGARLSDEARATLAASASARQAVDALLAAERAGDALTVIARALPRQYALAWACECVRRFMSPAAPTHTIDRAGLALAEAWLREPTEENRRAALDFAERDGFESAGGWIAAAAGWSGGSIAPAGYTAVPPGEHLTADAICGALAMLAAQLPEEIPARQRAFAQRALEAFGKPPNRRGAAA